jgi:hypothetical protein
MVPTAAVLVHHLQIADSKDAKSPTHIGDRTAASSISCFGGNRQCAGAEWLLFVDDALIDSRLYQCRPGRFMPPSSLEAKTGKPLWTFTTRAPRRLVASDRRWFRIRRLQGRPRLRARSRQRQERLGIRSRLARDVLPGRRQGHGRRRHGRRQVICFG